MDIFKSISYDIQGVVYSSHTLTKGSSIRGSYAVKDGTESVMGIAFRKNEQISSITFPEGLLSIGDAAFSLCTSLKHVVIPASVEYIGIAAFCCSGIESIEFHGLPKVIEKDAFIGCNALLKIIVPKGSKDSFSRWFDKRLILEVDNIQSTSICRNHQLSEYDNTSGKIKTIDIMEIKQILETLRGDYELRDSLLKKGFKVNDELENEINDLEQSLVSSKVMPELEAFANELLKDIRCEVYLSVIKDQDGNLKISNEYVSDFSGLHFKTPETQTTDMPEEIQIPDEVAPIQDEKNKSRAQSFGFKVTFPDGTVICEGKAAQTFFKTLKKIGLQRLANGSHGIVHADIPLVGTRMNRQKRNYQTKIGQYYIFSLLSNKQKIADIKHLSKFYNLGVKIEVENPLTKLFNTETAPIAKAPKRREHKDRRYHQSAYDINTIRGQFVEFMSHNIAFVTANGYVHTLDNHVRPYINNIIDGKADSIFSFQSFEDVELCIDILMSSSEFVQENAKKHNKMSASLKQYLQFVKSLS